MKLLADRPPDTEFEFSLLIRGLTKFGILALIPPLTLFARRLNTT